MYDPSEEKLKSMDDPREFTPVIFFKDTLNSENRYGRLTRWTRVDAQTAILYFDVFGQTVPEPLVIRYIDRDDWELVSISRFMRREFGKED